MKLFKKVDFINGIDANFLKFGKHNKKVIKELPVDTVDFFKCANCMEVVDDPKAYLLDDNSVYYHCKKCKSHIILDEKEFLSDDS